MRLSAAAPVAAHPPAGWALLPPDHAGRLQVLNRGGNVRFGAEAEAALATGSTGRWGPDLSQAVLRMGEQARARFGGAVVGVVGDSAGVPVAALLGQALATQARVGRVEERFSGDFSLACALTRLPPDADAWIIELSMLHPASLLRLARPQVVLVSDFQRPYAGNGLLESLMKRRLLRSMVPHGQVVLCRDVDGFDWLHDDVVARGLRPTTFGSHVQAEHRLLAFAGGVADIRLPGSDAVWHVPAPSRTMAMALLGALAVVGAVGGSTAAVMAGLGHIGVKSRPFLPTSQGNALA